MAFVADKDKQAQDQTNNGQFNQANQTAQLASGQGSQIAPQSQPQQNAQQNPTQPKQAGSGRFQNLQKYIQSNQAGAQQIGQRVQSNVNKQANQVGEAVNQAQQNLQQSSGQEIGRLNQGSDVINQAVANPTDYANNQDKFNQFQQLRTGQYQTQDIGNLANLQNKVQGVGDLANATQSEQGRAQLMRQTFNPQTNYSKSASRLDQLLLQSNPNNLREVSQTANQAAKQQKLNLEGLQGQKETYNQQIQDLVSQKQKEATQAVNTNLQQAQQSAADKYNQAIQNEAKFGEDYNRIMTNLQRGQITQADADKLGIRNLVGKSTMGEELLPYFSKTGTGMPVRQEETMSPEEIARANALSKLSGNVDIYSPTGANAYQASNMGYDANTLASKIGNREAQAKKEIAQAEALRNLTHGASLTEGLKALQTLGKDVNWNELADAKARDTYLYKGNNQNVLNQQTSDTIRNTAQKAQADYMNNPALQAQFKTSKEYQDKMVMDAINGMNNYSNDFLSGGQSITPGSSDKTSVVNYGSSAVADILARMAGIEDQYGSPGVRNWGASDDAVNAVHSKYDQQLAKKLQLVDENGKPIDMGRVE